MYLFNRNEAGRKISEIVKPKYDGQNNIVMALSPGGVMVGQEIAKSLGCDITLLLLKDIKLPGLENIVIGTVDQAGGFTYNHKFSAGQIEEMAGEYYQHIESEKLSKMHIINELMGKNGIIDRSQLNDKNIILVGDGLKNGSSVEATMEYLKPVRTGKVVAAFPFVSVSALDKLHILVDDLAILDVKVNYLDTDHYYEDNYIADTDEINEIMGHIDSGDPLQI